MLTCTQRGASGRKGRVPKVACGCTPAILTRGKEGGISASTRSFPGFPSSPHQVRGSISLHLNNLKVQVQLWRMGRAVGSPGGAALNLLLNRTYVTELHCWHCSVPGAAFFSFGCLNVVSWCSMMMKGTMSTECRRALLSQRVRLEHTDAGIDLSITQTFTKGFFTTCPGFGDTCRHEFLSPLCPSLLTDVWGASRVLKRGKRMNVFWEHVLCMMYL